MYKIKRKTYAVENFFVLEKVLLKPKELNFMG